MKKVMKAPKVLIKALGVFCIPIEFLSAKHYHFKTFVVTLIEDEIERGVT